MAAEVEAVLTPFPSNHRCLKMHNHLATILLAIVLVTGSVAAGADMVLLKSGERFQSQKAWREHGEVNYLEDGRVVRTDASEVERLIDAPDRLENKLLPAHRPTDDSQPAPDPPKVGQVLLQPLPFDDDTGWLGLKWGLALTQFEGLVAVETDPAYGGVAQYVNKKRNQRFGRASVDGIIYGFWRDRLYTIVIQTRNFLDFRDLKAEAFRRYGAGIQNQDDVEKYYWMDKGSDRMLSYDLESDSGFLWMRSKALHEQVRDRYPD